LPYKVSRKIFDRWEDNERSTITFVKASKAFRREYVNDITTEVLGGNRGDEFPLVEDLLDED